MKNFDAMRRKQHLIRWKLSGSLITVLFLIQLLFPLNGNAQQVILVRGTVTDTQGLPLPGATVLEEGTTNGTVTDNDGNYRINVPIDATLVFSFVGMTTQQVAVNSQNQINVRFVEEAIGLEEVVAIGYGTQSKTTVTVATSTVKGEDLADIPTTTVSSKLQGRLAGVSVRTISAQPGSELQIRVRGGSSINKSNNPLVLIDGFQRSLADINSNDIESIDVLKDASATAIYGSRASNGVILVTTKRGKNAETRIDFKATYGIQEFNRQYDLLNAEQYLQWWRPRIAVSRYGYSEGWIDGSQPTGTGNPESSTWTPRFLGEDEAVPEGWSSMVDPITGEVITFQNTNLQDILFRSAAQSSYNLSASGGSDKLKFATGLGYTKQDGVAIGTNYERMNGRLNIDFNVAEKLDVGVNSDFSYSKSNSFTNESNLFTRGALNAPTLRERFEDGTPGWGTNGTLANPQWVIETRDVTNQRYIANIGVNATWEITDGLTLSGSNFYFAQLGTYDYFEKAHEFSQLRNANAERSLLTRRQTEALIKYNKVVNEKHSFNYLLGYTDLYLKTDNANLQANGGASDKIPTLNVAPTKLEANTTLSDERMISHFTRLNYNYDLKYLISASLRRDGSSKFGSGNRFGYFPGVSVGWVASNEAFFPSGKVLEFVKFRASYGITGNNDIGRYVAQGVYQPGYSYGGNAATSATAMPNTAISWEKTHQADIGIELAFFEKRQLEITADVYTRRTEDLLFTVQLPRESGFNSVEQNVGSVEYKGVELSLTSRNITNSNFSWSTQFNFAYNINEVLKLPFREGIEKNRINGTILPDGTGFGGIAEGERLGSIIGYNVDFLIDNEEQAANARYDESANGYDPKTGKLVGRGTKFPGDLEWVDRDGDGRITSLDRFVLGYVEPTVTGGLTNTFKFNNFTFDIFMDYAAGHTIMDAVWQWMDGNMARRVATTSRVLDAWQKPGDAAFTNQPRSDYHDQNHQGNLRNSDLYATRGDFICLRNVSIGYVLPNYMINNWIKSLEFFATGNNIHYFSKYKGPNPERGGTINHSSGTYPPFRTFTLGVKVGL